MPLVSIRAYARHRGVSLAAVQKAIRSRRIELVDGRIDVDRADLEWERNTRPQREPLTYSAPQPPKFNPMAVLRDGHLALLAKLEAEERARRLINRSEMESTLLILARRIAPALARESDPSKVEAVLRSELRTACRTGSIIGEQTAWRCCVEPDRYRLGRGSNELASIRIILDQEATVEG